MNHYTVASYTLLFTSSKYARHHRAKSKTGTDHLECISGELLVTLLNIAISEDLESLISSL